MTRLTSELIVRLSDQVSGPAGKAAGALRGVGDAGRGLSRFTGSAAGFKRLAGDLEGVTAKLERIRSFRLASRDLDVSGLGFRRAQADLQRLGRELDAAKAKAAEFSGVRAFSRSGDIAREMNAARTRLRELQGSYAAAKAAAEAAAGAFKSQGSAVRALRGDLAAAGIPIDQLRGKETALKAAIEATTAAMARQGRASEIVARRREIATDRTRSAVETAKVEAARSATRRSSLVGPMPGAQPPLRETIADAATGVGAAAIAKRTYDKAVSAWTEMDEAMRRQRAILGFTEEQQSPLKAQSLSIGQDTRFSNPDVTRAQTRIGSSLSDHLKNPKVIAAITENSKNYALAMGTTMDQASEAVLARMLGMRYDMGGPEAAAKSAKHAANRLVQFAKSSGADHNDVMGYTKFGAAPGHVGGFSEEFSDALAAQLRRIGYEGSMGGNFVRAAATKLAVPTAKGRAALAGSGFDHSDYVAPGDALSVDNLEKSVKAKFGKGLSDDQRSRLTSIFENEEIVGNRDEFVPQVASILQETLARKTKKGAVNAIDAERISNSVNDYLSVAAGAVDIERLMKDVVAKKMSPALAKYLFGQEHGGRAQALDADTLEKDRKSFANTPDNRAEKVGTDINAGAYGAYQRMIGSVETFSMRLGQVNDGLLRFSWDKIGTGIDVLSGLPDKVLQFSTSLVAAGTALGLIKGAAATGAALGVPGAAATSAAAGAAIRTVPTLALGAAGAYLGTRLGETIVDIGEVAAGKYWQPKSEEDVADLRRQRDEVSARAADVEGRVHPSRRGEHIPEIALLRERIADLDNRIASQAAVKASAAEAVPNASPVGSAASSFGPSGPREQAGSKPALGLALPDVAKAKAALDALGGTVMPNVDATSLDAAETKAKEAKVSLDALGATVSPQVDLAALNALDAKVDAILAKFRQIGSVVSSVSAGAGKLAAAAASAGSNTGGDARTGKVKQAFSGAFADA